jgi:hypothetical protein
VEVAPHDQQVGAAAAADGDRVVLAAAEDFEVGEVVGAVDGDGVGAAEAPNLDVEVPKYVVGAVDDDVPLVDEDVVADGDAARPAPARGLGTAGRPVTRSTGGQD